MNMIKQMIEPDRKQAIVRNVLSALPDWFGIPEAIERFALESREQPFFAAFDGEKPIGFLYLKQTGDATVELAAMGVLKAYHRQGLGRALFDAAKHEAASMGYDFMQVKTVKTGMYPEYDATNRFYRAVGFREFELMPEYWDEANPCQIYVMALR